VYINGILFEVLASRKDLRITKQSNYLIKCTLLSKHVNDTKGERIKTHKTPPTLDVNLRGMHNSRSLSTLVCRSFKVGNMVERSHSIGARLSRLCLMILTLYIATHFIPVNWSYFGQPLIQHSMEEQSKLEVGQINSSLRLITFDVYVHSLLSLDVDIRMWPCMYECVCIHIFRQRDR